jgi:hypothetical protein
MATERHMARWKTSRGATVREMEVRPSAIGVAKAELDGHGELGDRDAGAERERTRRPIEGLRAQPWKENTAAMGSSGGRWP